MPTYCAFGCPFNPDIPHHRLPNRDRFPDRFKAWVNLLGGKLETDADYEKFKNKRICDIHFTIEQKNRNNRLNAEAVPILHLPGALVVNEESSTREPEVAVPEKSDIEIDLPDEDVESPCRSPDVDEEAAEELKDLPVTCHECHHPVKRHRFMCVSCSGCVVCVSCVTLGVHPTCYVLRVPPHRPLWEVQAVLQAVRSALAMSAFADQLAEPLAGYSIVDVKSEPGDYLDLKREDEIMEAVTADSVPTVTANPLAENKRSNKTSSILSVEPVPSGARSAQTTGAHESLTHDVESSAESRTDGISHPDPVGTESEAHASQINTDVGGKRVSQLCKIAPSKYNEVKDKVSSEPKTSEICVKSVTPPTVRISRDTLMCKVKSADFIRKLDLSADAKAGLLAKLDVIRDNKDTSGGPDKVKYKKPKFIGIRPLHRSVLCAESQATKQRLVTKETSDPKSSIINLPSTTAKEKSAALSEIRLGTSNDVPKIILRKRPFESVSDTPTPESLLKFEEKDSSKDKAVSQDLKYNFAHKLPKVKIVKKVDITNICGKNGG